MTKQWSASELEDRIRKEKSESSILSLSRSSVITLREFVEEGCVVIKSYRPESSPLYAQTYGQNIVLSAQSYYRNPSHYYRKEKALLEQLSDLEVTPKLYASVPAMAAIVMEYAGEETFSKKMLEIKADSSIINGEKEVKKNVLRERLLAHQVNFYQKTEELSRKRVRELLSRSKGDSLDVYLRSREEEEARLRHYFFKLVSGFSLEFKKHYPHLSAPVNNYDKKSNRWIQVKRSVKEYLGSKKIDFDEWVRDFQGQYHELIGIPKKWTGKNILESERVRFVHGDFGPNNVIYEKGRYGKILDLNECRIDLPHIDVVTALFNLFGSPTESRVPRLIADHFWKEVQAVKAVYPDVLDFLVGCTAVRAYQNLRIASANVDCFAQDVIKFTQGDPDYPDPENSEYKKIQTELNEQKFRQYRLEDLKKMIPYYTIGDGYETVLANCPKREKLKSFLEDIRHFLQVTYCMDVPETEKYTGKKVDELGKEKLIEN